MRKFFILFLPWMITPMVAMAQGAVRMQMSDGSEVVFSSQAVDTMTSTTEEQRMLLSFPTTENTSFSYSSVVSESEVNLRSNDKPQSDNLLLSISFLKRDNSQLQRDIVIDALDKSELKAVLPNGNDLTLIPNIKASSSHIYINGTRWKKGDKVNLSQKAEIKLVAFNGDVRTYSLQLLTSSDPIISIKTNGKITKDWAKNSTIKIGSSSLQMSIKGSGKHYGDNNKNSYRIKFDNKQSLLDMTKNKRWALVSLDGDNSLIRSALAYEIANSLSGLAWTPNYKHVDLVLNDEYLGHYLLVEQIRVCKGRIEDGYAVSIQDAIDDGDDYFYTAKTNSLFVIKDPETGIMGAGLVRTQDKIEAFEKALFSSGSLSSLIDMQSFVDYYLVNEIVRDEDAFVSDCYMNVRADGVIAMGPVWDLSKSFGYAGASAEGFIASRSPWFSELSKNSNFKSMVKSRFAEIYAKKGQLLNTIDEWAKQVQMSAASNDAVWKTLNVKSDELADVQSVYLEEISTIKQWLEERLDWIKSHLD